LDLGLRHSGVLVTGGSGGIGEATARAFAAEGAKVAVHYNRNRDAAEAIADDVGGVALQADLRDEDAADALVPAAVDALGRLDACVANAGVWPEEDVAVADMDFERWRATIEANLDATMLTARSYLRHARDVGAGSLVMVASTAAHFGEAGHADYAAAKAAIAYGLARSLKNEAGAYARVNVVSPGWTVTPMAEGSLTPDTLAVITSTMALRKVARPEDVARTIVWLSSGFAAGHVTGETITVAGGMEGRLLHPTSRSGGGSAPPWVRKTRAKKPSIASARPCVPWLAMPLMTP
jgi:3-oxoacyl-[acyl-carrier protein] reductase